MLFPTIQFALFFSVVFLVAWSVAHRPRIWRAVMLAASGVFYAAWDWRFVPMLVALAVVNQMAARAIARWRTRAHAFLVAGVSMDLGLLATFKYLGFFGEIANDFLARLGARPALPAVRFALPLGISFVTFQAISYVVDVYRRRIEPAAFDEFALYVTFFPHLIAGPIVRPGEIIPQLRAPRVPTAREQSRALLLATGGLFKKVVLASYLASHVVDGVFDTPARYTPGGVLGGVYGYAVQIYADFSGYTDIAIACALLLGVRFPKNFDAPYRAASLQEFWRRWHISLSSWLRDYVYIPLGGSRGSKLATYRNLFLTMLLGGLWHGAAWTFVYWGALHGAWLCVERFIRWENPGKSAPRRIAGWLVTFHVVCLGWVLFRAPSLRDAALTLARLGDFGTRGMAIDTKTAVVIALAIAAQFIPRRWDVRMVARFARATPVAQGFALALALAAIDLLGPAGVAPFIYFQF